MFLKVVVIFLSFMCVQSPAAAAAKSLQLCPTLCNPQTAAHQASRPWDSPGKNAGVGCHFLLQCMKVKSESEVAQSCPTLASPWTAAYQAPPSMGFSRQKYQSGVPFVQFFMTPWTAACQAPLSMGFFSVKNTGMGCHFLLHRILPTQESNPHLIHWQEDSLPLSHLGSPSST